MASCINDQSQFGYRTVQSILGECRTLLQILPVEGSSEEKSKLNGGDDMRDCSGLITSELDQWFDAVDARLEQVDLSLGSVERLYRLTPNASPAYTRALQTYLQFLSDKRTNQEKLLRQKTHFMEVYNVVQVRRVCRSFLQGRQDWQHTMYGQLRDVSSSYGFDISSSNSAENTLSVATVGENFCTVVDIGMQEKALSGSLTQLALEDIVEDAEFGAKFMHFFDACMQLLHSHSAGEDGKDLLLASKQVADVFIAFLVNIATQESVLTTSVDASGLIQSISGIQAAVESKFPQLPRFISTPYVAIQPANGITTLLSPSIGTHLLLVRGVDRQCQALFGVVPPVLGVYGVESIGTSHTSSKGSLIHTLTSKSYQSELQSSRHLLAFSTPALTPKRGSWRNVDSICQLLDSVKSDRKISVLCQKKYTFVSPMSVARYVMDHLNTHGVYLTKNTGGPLALLSNMLCGSYLPIYDIICTDTVSYTSTLPVVHSSSVLDMDSFSQCCQSIERSLLFSQLVLSFYSLHSCDLDVVKQIVNTTATQCTVLDESSVGIVDAYLQNAVIIGDAPGDGHSLSDDDECTHVAQWFTSNVKTKRRKGVTPRSQVHHAVNITRGTVSIITKVDSFVGVYTVYVGNTLLDSDSHAQNVQNMCINEDIIYEQQYIRPQAPAPQHLSSIIDVNEDGVKALGDYGISVAATVYNAKSLVSEPTNTHIAALFASVMALTRSIPFTLNWVLAYFNKNHI